MYLVLLPEQDSLHLRDPNKQKDYHSYCTDSIEVVNDAFRKRVGVKVYRLDALTEIKDVIPTYQEIIQNPGDKQ